MWNQWNSVLRIYHCIELSFLINKHCSGELLKNQILKREDTMKPTLWIWLFSFKRSRRLWILEHQDVFKSTEWRSIKIIVVSSCFTVQQHKYKGSMLFPVMGYCGQTSFRSLQDDFDLIAFDFAVKSTETKLVSWVKGLLKENGQP